LRNTTEKRKELDPYILGMIVMGFKMEVSPREISKLVGVNENTVKSIKTRYLRTCSALNGTRPGRPKKLSARDERLLVKSVREDPKKPFGHHKANLENAGVSICIKTLTKYLNDKGYHSFKAAHKLDLKPVHIEKRLAWTLNKVNWGLDDWKRVIWFDESKFNLVGNDGGIRVTRQIGERYKPGHIVPTKKFGSGSVMIWGCFWAGGLGPLVVLDGSVNQEKYIACLRDNFLPWLINLTEEKGTDFIFQEDGASFHTGKLSRKWKSEQNVIKGFDFWPAQSPDLNPIEHLWDYLERKIEARRHQMQNLDQLRACLQDEWQKIPLDLLQKLAYSIPSLCKEVIEAKGRTTKY
jgi:transposase